MTSQIDSELASRAWRAAVGQIMLVRRQGDRTEIALLEDGVLVELFADNADRPSCVGNVYLGKVQNVLPTMEAAFVDIGMGRNTVLYAGEVNFDATSLKGVAKRTESALKPRQSIMVQVTKDPAGDKGARLTSQISLPGRYLVYVPGTSVTGISRKLPDTERARIKQVMKTVAPKEGGIIVRTTAEGASEEELLHDVTRLVAQWHAIERKAKSVRAPHLLYAEPDLIIRVVRDMFNEDFTKLVIASDGERSLVDEYVNYVAPGLAGRLEWWRADAEAELFAAYQIDEQLAAALDRRVPLPGGSSLVIDTTGAMTVIHVDSSEFTGQGGNLEQTVTRDNLEAAEEIARQLRLRDIGGIIVIDFIDMALECNRDLVLRRLTECLTKDRAKHQVAGVTSLGLVQMTRKRVGSGLRQAFSGSTSDEQLAMALDRKVWLPGGGSLVIDTTEAMTVIDVNLGKVTGQGGNLEQAVTKNNLEAAEEIARQLRLRDIGGIIVIDFIDMALESNRDLVLRRLTECLTKDRAKHQVSEVTSLGLVQMTRKRIGDGP